MRCRCHPGGGGDDDNDLSLRGEEQDMPYTNADVLSQDRRRAEGGEDTVNNGGNKEHVGRHVRGSRQADTVDWQW